MTPRGGLCLLVLVLLGVAGAARFSSEGTPEDPEVTRRIPDSGGLFRGTLSSGEVERFIVVLRRGEVLALEVEQIEVDLDLVFEGRGFRWLRVDSPNRRWGKELATFIADQNSEVEIALSALAGRGEYRLKVEPIRPTANAEDRKRFAAALATDQAQRLRDQQDTSRLQAIEKLAEAKEAWRSLGAVERIQLTEIEMAQTWVTLGKPESALATYQQVLETVRPGPDRRLEAYVLNEISRQLFGLGRPAEAEESARQALEVARSVDAKADQAMALNLLAISRRQNDDPQHAIELNLQALALWQELGEKLEEAITLRNLGVSYLAVGRNLSAADQWRRAVELHRVLGDARGEATCLMLLGQVYTRDGRVAEAEVLLEQALSLLTSLEDEGGQAQILERLAYLAEQAGQLADADRLYQQALDVYRRRQDPLRLAYTQSERGFLRATATIALGDARPDLEAALASFRSLGEPMGEAYALLGLAFVEKRAGRPDVAFKHAWEALEKVEMLRNRLRGSQTRQAYLHGRRRYFAMALELSMQLHQSNPRAGHDRVSFEISELARARALLDQLAETPHAEGAAMQRPAELETLRNELEAKRFVRWQRVGTGGEAELEVEIRDLLAKFETLEAKWLRERPANSPRLPARPISLEETQALLDDDSLLLEFFLGSEQSYLWLVGRDTFQSFVLPPATELEPLARRLHAAWSQGDQAMARRQGTLLANRLASELLGPARPWLTKKRLVIAADGALAYLPFGALPNSNGGVLQDQYELVSIHSASVLALQRRLLADREPATGRLAVVADPLLAPPSAGTRWTTSPEVRRSAAAAGVLELPPLPHARLEAETLLAMPTAAPSRGWLGAQASRPNVLGGELAHFQLLHFATHGLIDSQMPQLSGLVLSTIDEQGNPRDGFLPAYEIERIFLPAELVVLSACRTGLGEEVAGEGLVGLSQSFLAAGARQVAVSLWAVDDRSTSELMIELYQGLLNLGQPPAAALGRAQGLLRSRYPDSPYHWGAFVLYGDWQHTPNKKP